MGVSLIFASTRTWAQVDPLAVFVGVVSELGWG